jgi:phospholipase/carboxylesterase
VNPHLAAPPVTVGPPVADARRVAVVVHGRDQDPEYMLEHLVARLDAPDVAFVLPAAAERSWYPARYFDPREANEPWLGHALAALEAAIGDVEPERVVLTGFSQGACLVADLLGAKPGSLLPSGGVARAPRRFAGAAILTGAFIAAHPEPAGLDGVPVFMESSRYDEWVALDDVEATAEAFEAAGARVTLEVSDDREHRIRDAAVAGVRALL